MIAKLPKDITIRNSKPSDHHRIINVLKEWWGGGVIKTVGHNKIKTVSSLITICNY